MQRPDVDEFFDEMTPEQFAEWQAFDFIEPIGEHRADWRNAQLICSIGRFLAGMWGATSEVTERDYMPFVFPKDVDGEIREEDPEIIFAKLHAIASGLSR